MNHLKVPELKKISKIHGLKTTNKCKAELLKDLEEYFAVKKIQRFFRKKIAIELVCPITLDTVKYPLFAYKPKGHSLFIYYNLLDLANYLTETGDFRDPKNRDVYDKSVLENIDKELVKNGLKINKYKKLVSVVDASKNRKYYSLLKNNENHMLVLETCLDELIDTFRQIIINNSNEFLNKNVQRNISMTYINAYKNYFNKLKKLSPFNSNVVLDRTIVSINETYIRLYSRNQSNNYVDGIRENIVLFLYTLL